MTAANVVTAYTSFQGDGGNVGKGVTTDSNPTTNDYLVVCILGSANADSMTKPDVTWTEVAVSDNSIAIGGGAIRVWYKKNPAASTSYSWTCSSGRTSSIGALVRGADGTSFVNIAASLESAPGTNHAPPSVTSTTADGLVLDFIGMRQFSPDVSNWTVPSAGLTWTEIADIQGADGNNNCRLALGSAVQASAGSVPTNVWTNTDTFEEAICIRIVVTPAVTGGGTQTITPGTIGNQDYRATGGVLALGTVNLAPGISSSAERIGPALLTPGTVSLSPGSPPVAERVGPTLLAPGTVNLSPCVTQSSERFGAQSLIPGTVALAPGASSSQERIGSALLAPGAVTVAPGVIQPGEAFGSVAFGVPTAYATPGTSSPQERFGGASIVPGVVTLSPGTIGESERFGSVSIFSPITQTLSPGTIYSEERFGYASLVDVVDAPGRIPTYTVRLDRQIAEADLTRPIYKVRLDGQYVEVDLTRPILTVRFDGQVIEAEMEH